MQNRYPLFVLFRIELFVRKHLNTFEQLQNHNRKNQKKKQQQNSMNPQGKPMTMETQLLL